MKHLILLSSLVIHKLISKADGAVHSSQHDRPKRTSDRNLACEILVAIDEPLFEAKGGSFETVIELADDSIKELNKLLHRTIFTGKFSNLYLRLKNVVILYDFCLHCNGSQHLFLQEFTKIGYSDYCFALLFTYRDFPAGIAGLAWRGTICEKKSNTGFVTFLNNEVDTHPRDIAMTIAHETGHIFGAHHDEQTECANNQDRGGGDFLMSSSGTYETEPRFSECSLRFMRKRLDQILNSARYNCFKYIPQEVQRPGFCGNGILEEGEVCDCGTDYRFCRDPCCYAGHLSPIDRYYNASARSCQLNQRTVCLEPFAMPTTFGVTLPFVFIVVACTAMTCLLRNDWKKEKKFFLHIDKSQGPITDGRQRPSGQSNSTNSCWRVPTFSTFSPFSRAGNGFWRIFQRSSSRNAGATQDTTLNHFNASRANAGAAGGQQVWSPPSNEARKPFLASRREKQDEAASSGGLGRPIIKNGNTSGPSHLLDPLLSPEAGSSSVRLKAANWESKAGRSSASSSHVHTSPPLNSLRGQGVLARPLGGYPAARGNSVPLTAPREAPPPPPPAAALKAMAKQPVARTGSDASSIVSSRTDPLTGRPVSTPTLGRPSKPPPPVPAIPTNDDEVQPASEARVARGLTHSDFAAELADVVGGGTKTSATPETSAGGVRNHLAQTRGKDGKPVKNPNYDPTPRREAPPPPAKYP